MNMSDSGSGIVTTNWKGGEWAQYTVYSATNNATRAAVAFTTAAYQTANPTLTYQLLLNYSNSSATASSFSLANTSTDPATGIASLSTLATFSLPGTGGAYQTISTTLTLPRDGQNILRLVDNDASGVSSHVNVDYFKLINATTSGNNQVPWEVPASGTVEHIPADDVDIAPGSAVYPTGTRPG